MKAVEYAGSRTFQVTERTPRPPAAGEVQVKVAFVGLCGTDLHVYLGDMDRVPVGSVIGHEMSGTVAALGEGVSGVGVLSGITARAHELTNLGRLTDRAAELAAIVVDEVTAAALPGIVVATGH